MMKTMRTIKGCIAVWIFVLLTSVASNDAYAKLSFGTQLETLLTSNGAQYDSGSGTYTLTQNVMMDMEDPFASDSLSVSSDMTIDLNGYTLLIGYNTGFYGSYNLVFKNSNSGTRAKLNVRMNVPTGKQWRICEGIDVGPIEDCGYSHVYGSLYVESGVTFDNEFFADSLTEGGSLYFAEGSKIHEHITDRDDFSLGFIPAGASLSGPDADGYYTVVKPQPEINLISAAQRYPWNNMVDYTYALSNCNASKTYKLAVGLTVGGVTKVSTNDLTTVSDGNYTGTIDAATLFPNTFDKAGKIKLQLIEVQ